MAGTFEWGRPTDKSERTNNRSPAEGTASLQRWTDTRPLSHVTAAFGSPQSAGCPSAGSSSLLWSAWGRDTGLFVSRSASPSVHRQNRWSASGRRIGVDCGSTDTPPGAASCSRVWDEVCRPPRGSLCECLCARDGETGVSKSRYCSSGTGWWIQL